MSSPPSQQLLDEHSELQLEFNIQEKKKKELEAENDRLVSWGSTCTHVRTVLVHMIVCFLLLPIHPLPPLPLPPAYGGVTDQGKAS